MKEERVQKIKEYFNKKGFKKSVVGLSGGVDSSVVCFLLSEALGSKNVYAFSLPYFDEDPDVRKVVDATGVNFERISIKASVDLICETLGIDDKVDIGNVMARVRMIILYYFARKYNALVAGTGNKTEYLLGYFTKHGDIACDFLPIGSLYKTEVYELAHELGIPESILRKKPTAGLWPGQTDEEELGCSYEEIDAVLKSKNTDSPIWERVLKTEHKRGGPDIL